MGSVVDKARAVAARPSRRQLEQRVADLETDVAELRRHQMRMAELTDIVQELLVPMASRDEEAVQQAIERFQESL